MNGEEMMDDYGLRFNAPKNFKNGRLIGNRYRIIDLVIVLAGASLSALSLILYISFLHGHSLPAVVTMFIPGALCYVITLPTGGVYHNNMVLLQVLIRFAKARKNYLWEGIYKEDNEKE